jgi:glycosyltransferase involved in cell wall biosynthesis
VQVYGKALTKDPQGYRLLLDYFRVWAWIRSLSPQVLEAGDAWLTSWFCLILKATGIWKGRLVSFYHSDPVPSYLQPWSRRGSSVPARFVRRVAVGVFSRLFYALQRRFDFTAVASRAMEASLKSRGLSRIRTLPFGTHPVFFHAPAAGIPLRRLGADAPLRCLYAGRLDRDKGLELLLEILPALLEDPLFQFTVAGRGALESRVAALHHERFHYAGFLPGPEAMADLFSKQDLFLAPGPFETFGLGVLEASASGLIVVGPAAGGTGELLEEMNSPFRFRSEDAQDFLAKIRHAAVSNLQEWSAKHRATAAEYGAWDQSIGRMVAAWSESAG